MPVVSLLVLALAALLLPPVVARAQSGGASADQLFDDRVLHRLELQMNSEDWRTLQANYLENDYYPATMVWRGEVARNVGVRSRGSGTRSAAKPGLRVDFNRYVSGQQFRGLDSLVLDNHLQDPTGMREAVSMALFAKMGLPAPRESHAEVYLNGEFLGVYAIVEEIDELALGRLFPSASGNGAARSAALTSVGSARTARTAPAGADRETTGIAIPRVPSSEPPPASSPGPSQPTPYLFEYEWQFNYYTTYLGSDLETWSELFDPETRDEEPLETLYGPIERLFYEINEAPDADWAARVGAHLDVEQFVRLAAVQAYLAEWDGLVGAFGINNFYLTRPAAGGVHRIVPWDADNTFHTLDYPIDAEIAGHVLMRRALRDPALRSLYVETLLQAAALADAREGGTAGWLESEITRRWALVGRKFLADPSKPFTNAELEADVPYLLRFARERGAFVRADVARIFGSAAAAALREK